MPVSRPRPGSEPLHLLVDSTGLKLCGPGEWLVEKQAERTRRSWRKLHIGVDTGQSSPPPSPATMSMTARRSVPCLSRLPDRLRRLPAMGPTIGTMSTVRSASVIRMRRSLCRRVRTRCPAPRQKPRRRSFPGGIPSHAAPETPGSIHEGGELGYSLSHAYGAALGSVQQSAFGVKPGGGFNRCSKSRNADLVRALFILAAAFLI